ncbi:MAG: hypothetical protein ACLP0J_18510 [Solirubrobacteraceae bacterium]
MSALINHESLSSRVIHLLRAVSVRVTTFTEGRVVFLVSMSRVRQLLRWSLAGAICAGCLAVPSAGLADSPTPATATPATIDGVVSSAPVVTMGEAQMNAAVAQAPSLPVTSAETSRLAWLNDGHIDQMTLYDATIAAEIAKGPWILTSDTTASLAATTSSATARPAVNTGTCWYGNQNQKTYSDLFGGSVTIDAGITGYCDGPGGQAIVARGNYEGGINLNYTDACNDAPQPYFHIQNTNYDGPNPQLIEMLNTANDGDKTPFGCIGEDNYASADWVNYQGNYGPYNYIGLGWGQPGWGSETAIGGPYTCCSTVTNN